MTGRNDKYWVVCIAFNSLRSKSTWKYFHSEKSANNWIIAKNKTYNSWRMYFKIEEIERTIEENKLPHWLLESYKHFFNYHQMIMKQKGYT
jgi:hypothetical protein